MSDLPEWVGLYLLGLHVKSCSAGQSTQLATQELLRLVESNADGFPALDPVSDLHILDLDLVQDVKRFQYLSGLLPTFDCVRDPLFDKNFRHLRDNMQVSIL